MPPTKTPARRRLDELLADGAWHDRDRLLEQTVGLIPPGQATRRARSDRANKRARYARALDLHGIAPEPAVGGVAPSDDTRVGARTIAMGVIKTAVDRGAYERRTLPDGTVQIRRRPKTGGE